MNPLLGRERIDFTEAAARLDVTRRSLFMWVATGKFPRPHKFGGRNFYFEDDFARFVEEYLTADTEKKCPLR